LLKLNPRRDELNRTWAVLAHRAQERERIARGNLKALGPFIQNALIVGKQAPHEIGDGANAMSVLLQRHRARQGNVMGVAPPLRMILEAIAAVGALRNFADLLVGQKHPKGPAQLRRLKPVLAMASRSMSSSAARSMAGSVSSGLPIVIGSSSALSIWKM